MARKCIVWGLETEHTSVALKRLEKDLFIDILAWFGHVKNGSHVTHHVYDFQGRCTAVNNSSYGVVKHSVFDEVFQRCLYTLLETASRSYQEDFRNHHDLCDIISTQINYFESLLESLKVDLIIFHNIPHEGPDYILYQIACATGVEVLIFSQSLFSNRFFVMRKIDEGYLDGVNYRDHNYAAPRLVKTFRREYFYMKKRGALTKLNFFLQNFRWASKVLLSFFALLGFKRSRRYYYRFFSWLDFQFNKIKHSVSAVPDNMRFVYFPLHLQPEMTTSALGGIFCDQLLAIERVRDLIPVDWLIVVKENPKQTYVRRGDSFYARLSRIPNALYLTDGDSASLISRCEFVGTVTGSAGWEAICGGKKVLVFGNAWYMGLPGTFKFHNNLKINEILECRIDFNELQSAFDKLMSATLAGVVDVAYSVLLESYSRESNNEILYESLLKLLNTGCVEVRH